jgi:hypothetical protein
MKRIAFQRGQFCFLKSGLHLLLVSMAQGSRSPPSLHILHFFNLCTHYIYIFIQVALSPHITSHPFSLPTFSILLSYVISVTLCMVV